MPRGQAFDGRRRRAAVSPNGFASRQTPPAIVVASLPGDDEILCPITSQARSDGFSLPLEASDFARGQLRVASFIRPNRLFTVEQCVILYVVGRVTDSKLVEVRSRIRQILA